jgi:hypothetical protein
MTNTPKSVPVMARLPTNLNDRIEFLVKERGFGCKSDFLRAAAIFYVEFCEVVNLDEIQKREADRFYSERRTKLAKTSLAN